MDCARKECPNNVVQQLTHFFYLLFLNLTDTVMTRLSERRLHKQYDRSVACFVFTRSQRKFLESTLNFWIFRKTCLWMDDASRGNVWVYVVHMIKSSKLCSINHTVPLLYSFEIPLISVWIQFINHACSPSFETLTKAAQYCFCAYALVITRCFNHGTLHIFG